MAKDEAGACEGDSRWAYGCDVATVLGNDLSRSWRGIASPDAAGVREAWSAAGAAPPSSGAPAAPPPLLLAVRAALAALPRQRYDAHDGAALRDALAARERADLKEVGMLSELPRWAAAGAGVELVVLTPARSSNGADAAASDDDDNDDNDDDGTSGAPSCGSARLLLARSRGGNDAVAAETLVALLTARSWLLKARQHSDSAGPADYQARAIGAVLSADGGTLRLCSVVSYARYGGLEHSSYSFDTVSVSRPCALVAPPPPHEAATQADDGSPPAARGSDGDADGFAVLSRLLSLDPADEALYPMRVRTRLRLIMEHDIADAPSSRLLDCRAEVEACTAEIRKFVLEINRAHAAALEKSAGGDAKAAASVQKLAELLTQAQRTLDMQVAKNARARERAEADYRCTSTRFDNYIHLLRLLTAAREMHDAPLGRGNHSTVYALRLAQLPRPFSEGAVEVEEALGVGGSAMCVAKVAYTDDAKLAEEAAVLRQLRAARCASVPRLLHVTRSSHGGEEEGRLLRIGKGKAAAEAQASSHVADGQADSAAAQQPPPPPRAPPPPPVIQPAFIIMTPLGTPLSTLVRRLPDSDADADAIGVRAALAECVATGLLDALRASHAAGVAHMNIKILNVVLVPPLPPCESDSEPLTAADVAVRTAVLVDWGGAPRLGAAVPVRAQCAFAADAVETLLEEQLRAEKEERERLSRSSEPLDSALDFKMQWYAGLGLPMRTPLWTIRPQWDLESVAFLYAALRGGCCHGDPAKPPWRLYSRHGLHSELDKAAPPRDAALEARAAAEMGLMSRLGPRAWARYHWLAEHPDALGARGERFLAHVRAGRAVYSLDISDKEHAAFVATGCCAPLGAAAVASDSNACE